MKPDAWTRWPEFNARIDRWRAAGALDFGNGACAIAPGRNLALEGYMFWTFAALSDAEIGMAESRAGLNFPPTLRAFYQHTNGAIVFSAISICAFVADLTRDVDAPQPVDFMIDNFVRPHGVFIFGGMSAWSAQTKLGIRQSGEVLLVNGARVDEVLKTWASFDTFLFEEMDRLETLFDQSGHFVGTYAERLPIEARRLERDQKRRPS